MAICPAQDGRMSIESTKVIYITLLVVLWSKILTLQGCIPVQGVFSQARKMIFFP
jgi:hypothetical protein